MEKQNSDECPSNKQYYDKLVLGDPTVLENVIPGMNGAQLIEFYDYCQEMTEAEGQNCELYWYASLFLEETDVVKMYINGQLYVDTTLGAVVYPEVSEPQLTDEDKKQIDEIVRLIEERKKQKNNPLYKLKKWLKG